MTSLLLCVASEDASALREVNDLLQADFISEKEISAPLYGSHWASIAKGLGEMDRSPFRNLLLPPCPKSYFNIILAGNWSTEDPTSDKAGKLSLAVFFPFDEKLRQTIETNIDFAQAGINVGQASHNCTKILTSTPKSWIFKTQFTLVAALGGLNAELLNASNKQLAPGALNLDSDNKPTLCVYNKALIHLLESNNGIKWFSCFQNEYPRIPCFIAHKVGSCYSQICKVAHNYLVNKIAQQGSAPAVSSRFATALGEYRNLIDALDTTISTGINVGTYDHLTS